MYASIAVKKWKLEKALKCANLRHTAILNTVKRYISSRNHIAKFSADILNKTIAERLHVEDFQYGMQRT